MTIEQNILAELKKTGVGWITWLPDSETKTMFEEMSEDSEINVVQVCHESEAIGVCYGLSKGGAGAAVMIQNTGLNNAVDAIRGIPMYMKQPMLLIIGYRGYVGMVEEREQIDSAAVHTEPILQALNIPHHLIRTEDDVDVISLAHADAERTSGPAAVLIVNDEE